MIARTLSRPFLVWVTRGSGRYARDHRNDGKCPMLEPGAWKYLTGTMTAPLIQNRHYDVTLGMELYDID